MRGAALSSSPDTPVETPQSARKPTVAGTVHTIVALCIIAVWATWGYFRFNSPSFGAHPQRAVRYVLLILWEWSFVAYIAWGALRNGTSLENLVGGKWATAKDVFKDIAISLGFWITALVVLAATAIGIHVQRTGEAARILLPQTHLDVFLWVLTSLTAGICEEIIFRGYLQRQFCAWVGTIPAGVVLSAAVFGAVHLYQGGKQAIVVAMYGVLFGILAEMRQSLRPGMIAHAWHDSIVGLLVRLIRT